MIQSFLEIFSYFFKQIENPLILLCFGIFVATAVVYIIRRLMKI